MVDLDGNLVTNKQFEGKWLLLYFGFARCPDICPSEMLKVGKVMDTLAEKYPEVAKQIVPVFVSVDPARDSLKGKAKRYGRKHALRLCLDILVSHLCESFYR